MAYNTYLDLVNAVRDRFNEPHLTEANFNIVVGFDQFTKDAINYAYHDILNAEMEWPFLHQKITLQTVPGQIFYTVNTNNAFVVKEIDWDSFFIAPNTILTQINDEVHTIPSTAPYVIYPTNVATWTANINVSYQNTGNTLIPVTNDPQAIGQYTIQPYGSYYFNAADAGTVVLITYVSTVPSVYNVINPNKLVYMDYDLWREVRLNQDLNLVSASSLGMPTYVIKTQEYSEILFSPVPDKIYIVNFECWVDPTDLVVVTDTPLFPSRFNQIILDGAQKYCYEFREDPTQAQMADKRFIAGIQRMRTELINRQENMKAGFYWYRRGGYFYTYNTI